MQSNPITRFFFAATVFAAVVGTSPAAQAERNTHRTIFDVRFGALPIGEATFDIRLRRNNYFIAMHGKTVGVAEMVAPGDGIAASNGSIDGGDVVAQRHTVRYTEKEKQSKLNMDFEDGAVEKVSLRPDNREKKNGPKWIQLTPDHLRNVIDPASSVVIPVEPDRVDDGNAVCNRTLNIYDGDTRFDMILNYKSTAQIDTQGYEGKAFVCQLRYLPVAGHERDQRNIKYMRENEKMEIWLAPTADSQVFTPIKVVVPTWIGNFTAEPRYFGQIPKDE